ncbi:MAG TPA: UDP-N-acetylglucosamine 2-epimerase (non-hydrolyzing) [Sphingomicrobium sp.]
MGTRPEAIKLAPVAHALEERGLSPSLIVTGQHRELDLAEHGLASYPAIQLTCPGEEDPHAHVAKVASALQPILDDAPNLLIVQGDTSSALGGARAAVAAEVPLAHVEAGLRTRDRARPWPEEEYRTEIDAKADLLFAPTDLSALNLACERVRGRVHVTGNTGIDALNAVVAELPSRAVHDRALPRLLVTCHRRESWGEGLRSVASAVREIASGGRASAKVIVPPNNHVAGALREQLQACPNISLLEPCSHRQLVRRMRDSELILSDSGGMQEEAPALGVPLLVLREKTERPEGIGTGNIRLVGTCKETIVAETLRVLADPAAYAAMSRPAFPYGDGRAAPRIASIIEEWLKAREVAVTSARISHGLPARRQR